METAYQNILSGNTPAQAAGGMLNKTLQGGYSLDNPYLSGGTATPGGSGQGLLDSTIRGDYVGGNPYLDQVFATSAQNVTDQFNRNILPSIRAAGVQSGMYDSSRRGIAEGLAAGEAQKNLAQLSANIYAPAYESERSRQMQAAGLQQEAQQDYYNRLLQGANLYQGGYENERQRQMQAAGLQQEAQQDYYNRLLQGANLYQGGYENERQRQMAAAGLAPSLSNWDAQQLMGLGGIEQDMMQRELDAMQQYWNEYQQAPWSRLGSYTTNVMGMGTPGGTTSTTQAGAGGFSPTGMLGGAALGAGIGGMLPAAMMASPWAWPLAIGGGALLGSGIL
jgi:hypothetical protein